MSAPAAAGAPAAPAGQATNTGRLLTGLGLLPVLGVLVIGLSLVFGARGVKLLMVALATVTGMVALLPAIVSAARPVERRHLLFSLLGLAHILFFVLPIFARYLSMDFAPPFVDVGVNWVRPPMLVVGQLAVLLGLVALMIGYAIPIGTVLSGMLPQPRRDWSASTTFAVACIGVPVGWVMYLAIQFRLIPATAGTAILNPISDFTLTGFVLLTLVYIRSGSRKAVMLMVALTPITMGFNFFTGSKGKFFGPLVMILLTYLLVERRVRVAWVVGGAVVVVLFFPAAQYYRNVVSESLTRSAVDVIREGPGAAVREIADFASGFSVGEWISQGLEASAGRFDGLGILTVIIQETPERVPFQGGRTIAYAMIFWVPRLLWPGKPGLSMGRWVTDTYTEGAGLQTSTGSTWIGELYFNFGWLGIGFGMLIVGILFRVLHEILLTKRATIPGIVAGVLLVDSVVRAIGGGLLSIVAGTFWSLTPMFVLHLVVRFFGGTVPIETVQRHPSEGALRAPPGLAGGKLDSLGTR